MQPMRRAFAQQRHDQATTCSRARATRSRMRRNVLALPTSATLTMRASRMPAPRTLSRSSGHGSSNDAFALLAAVVGERHRSPACLRQETRPTALPANRRWQLSTMASNTGCVSVIDPLMTRRISAVAVWRSSASLRLVEQAHVLDGDHRLVGEGRQQRDLLVAGTVRAGAATAIEPTPRPSHSIGAHRIEQSPTSSTPLRPLGGARSARRHPECGPPPLADRRCAVIVVSERPG